MRARVGPDLVTWTGGARTSSHFHETISKTTLNAGDCTELYRYDLKRFTAKIFHKRLMDKTRLAYTAIYSQVRFAAEGFVSCVHDHILQDCEHGVLQTDRENFTKFTNWV